MADRPFPTITPDIKARFWSHVDKAPGHGPSGDCWIWTGSGNRQGYGHFSLAGRMRKAHQVSLILAEQSRPPSGQALHSCDVPSCVNPQHLRWGSPSDNLVDRVERNGWTVPKCPRERKARGEAATKAGLTEADVLAIRLSPLPHKAVAREYGLTGKAVSMIRMRRSWGHMPVDPAERDWTFTPAISDEAANLIRAATGSHRAIGAAFGVSHRAVGDIKRGKCHAA